PPLTQAQLKTGRIVAVDDRTALNPVSYWLDRPIGRPRAAAADLARRIAAQAGLATEKLEAFLQDDA
ncbi:transcriptional regulator, partial [Mesorhizobium sp. M4B.F.Ca.ET.088.02.2.1]